MKLDSVKKAKESQVVVYKPPGTKSPRKAVKTVFLAGSIEMGKADDWQSKVAKRLEADGIDVDLFNPRRDDWDSSWKQTIDDKNFYGQVKWEFDHLTSCDIIFLYFDPETKAPISLLELGLFAGKKDVIVVCPDGFYRKGNVEFVCKQFSIDLFNKLDDGISELLKYLN